MKILFLFAALLIVSHSCQSVKNDLDISDYYYDFKNLESPKVFQYFSYNKGADSIIYSKISRINSHDLLLEQYNNSFKVINRTLLEYSPKGVKYKEVWVSNLAGNTKLFQHTIIDSLVFPFNLKDSPIKSSSEGMTNDNSKMIVIVTNQLTEPRDTIIKDQKTTVIYGHAKRTWTVTSLNAPFNSTKMDTRDLIVYQKGVGIIQITTYYQNKEFFRMDLEKILTLEEFERIKNAS